ncbi:peptidoglycan-binding protein, partial [Mycobacterium kansasii]
MPLDSKLKLDDIARLQSPGATPTKHRVELLHQALGTLGLPVDAGEVDEAKLGKTTSAAVKVLQERAGLDQTGKFNKSTVDALKVHVEDQLLTASSYRAGRIQQLLTDAGVAVDPGERKTRTFGPSTRDQLKEFAAQAGLRDDGLVTQDVITALRAHALTRKLGTKTQTSKLQKTMLRAARARNIDLHIDGTEMRTKELGPSTQAAIRTLQARFGLPATGTMDPETFDRVHAAAASKPRKPVLVSAPDPTALKPIPRALRLNATNKDVPVLQRTLAFLGHAVNETEFKDTRFGASTRAAVLAFQKSAGLPETGHVDRGTLAALNQAVIRANPAAAATTARIRGTVRDTAWAGIKGASVELRTRAIGGAGVVLGQRATLANGFFDLPYTAPVDAATGKPVSPLLLTVTYRDPAGAEIGRKNLTNPPPMAWANFTQGDRPYAGPSDYEVRLAAISAAAKGAPLILLTETAERPDISHVALACGLAQDDVMRMVLAARVSSKLAGGALDIAVVYAFLQQSLPPTLPDELLASTHEWELIDQLVENTANGIAFMESPLQEAALDSALAENLIPVTVGARRADITAALAANRTAFALHKPLLVGNGSLASVLGTSTIPAGEFDRVAEVFVSTRGFGNEFWTGVNAALPGLETQVQDFKQSVEVGLVVKNHLPTMTFMKDKIADPADGRVSSARDLAKLTPQEWSDYISANGNAIPDGTDGATLPARRETFARTLAAQSERIFPTVAFVAEVGRSTQTALTKVDEVAALVDAHEDLDLRTANVDGFVASNAIAVDDDVRADLRVLQRAHRLAPTASTGRALLDNHLHSSMQILSMGKAELVQKLGASGVDQPTALSIHGYALFQYANVLARLGDFRAEIHQSDPAAVVPQGVSVAERADLLGQIPDLELLFGPLDVCDCAHCASVYGPAAYLADLLRFLDAHPSQVAGRTVREILTDRRPDLVTTKLNCPNTETAVPYIDLVCEILEAAVTGADPDGQTTRPAEELRAVPEHQRDGAYDTLRSADFPMTGVFDLWQEDARVLLEHLGVPRWRLMGVFGDPDADAVSIAAEQLGISSHETSIITTAAATPAAQQKFWGLDPDQAEIPVLDVMGHAHLTYEQILELRTLTWINPPGAPAPVQLARPVSSASLGDQRMTGITVDVLDRIHRLLRLSRHVPWDLWELDLLVRTTHLGGGAVNGPALVALRDAAQLQGRLNVPAETLATWFGDLPRQGRPDPA